MTVAAVDYGRGIAPHPIDVRVGARVKQRRQYLGMGQVDLARLLGLTFQQVQKYESGMNRISAGRLSYVARLLDVPVAWFFEERYDLTREEIEVASLYARLTPAQATSFLALAQHAAGAR